MALPSRAHVLVYEKLTRTRKLLFLALPALLIAAVARGAVPAPAVAPAVAAPPSLALTPCKLPGLEEDARCGTLEVPEDRQHPEGRKISLRIAVLPARGTAPAPDPVFALAGGPGESAVGNAAIFAQLLGGIRGERDVVLVDQRGTGGSNRLDCPLPGSDDDPQSYLGDFLPVEALRACLGRLRESGTDPALYTTVQAVEDLEAVRAALGYEKVDLYGVSYGSRVALVYLRNHSDRVRSAVLQGVAPTNMAAPLHHAEDSQRSLELLLGECAADEACRAAYPDLTKKLAAVEERLARAPATAEITDPKTKRRVKLTISLDLFNEEVRWRLYVEGLSPIPDYIQRAYDGDFAKLAASILRQRRGIAAGVALSVGAYLSSTCAEDVPLIDPEEAKRLARGTFLGTYRVDQQVRACSVWPRGQLPPGFAGDVRSDVPVLLISGERDPATPPRWGEQAARSLSHSLHVILRRGAHSGRSPCARALLADFLARGTAEGLDVSCAAETLKVDFVMPPPAVPAEPAPVATPAPAPAPPAPPPATATAERLGSAEGLWEGVVFIQRGWLEVELTVELFQGGPAGWAGTADLPTQGLQFVPLSAIAAGGTAPTGSTEPRTVAFEIHHPAEGGVAGVDARFDGELSADGRTIAGKFLEEGKTLDFALQRIGDAGMDRPAPVHPDLHLIAGRGDELKELFNRDQDKLRLVILLSPT